MGRVCHRELALLQLLGYLACLTRADVSPLGRVFLLELESFSKGVQEKGFEAATHACMAQGARVASRADLHHAVLECAFSACSRGWLSGPSIGTTVCSGVPGSLRPVDVQLENLTADTERLGVFCVKESDAPCGQPPSFPHSHLQGKTGLDLGDELLYACDPGYKLPNGDMAFSLLCDSCGDWYSLVQHCIKDDPEGHIDNEDKFTDGHLLENPREEHHISLNPGGTQSTDHEVEESSPEPERRVMSEEEKENDEDSTVSITEPPVSQLSQKHMFWFPSEAFQEEKEQPGITTDSSSIKSPNEDKSHMMVKTTYSQSGPDMITEKSDYLTDPPISEPASPSVGGTDESWLDGYPVTQDEDKAGGESTGEAGPEQGAESETETLTGDSEVEVFEDETKNPVEEKTGGLIDNPEEEEDGEMKKDKIHRKGDEEELGKGTTRLEKGESVVTPYEETTEGLSEDEIGKETYTPEETDSDGSKTLGFDGLTDSPNGVEVKPTTSITQITPSPDDIAVHKWPMPYTPASAPENVSASQGGLGPEKTSTPSGMVHLDGTPDYITSMPTPVIKDPWETIDDHFLEHIPVHVPTETSENRSVMEHGGDHSLDQQDQAGKGACAEDPCHGSGRGPMIAAIIIGIVAAVMGVVLGVWCYKKRQQKSSHYQLNGTNRQTQCIELQQTV
ncbi:sushi domain-containing protein 5-like [Sinocyclocheilus grahami]|uniref:sushi domain-containing protein 5-like n=1 Tax=Sinocyclocheilus grahami TaxID=75366 RepID=UPI0007ACB52D|nr:PREDICTED: sushi domain-containing protein 5-like [Sinocyclocheilus grahami]